MRHLKNQRTKLQPKLLTLSTILLCGFFFLSSPVHGSSVTFNLFGNFGEAGAFGGAGVENGSFNGSFTLDLLAADDQADPALGVYALADWSINIFFDTGVLADNLAPDDGGVGEIFVEPGGTGSFGNLSLQLETVLDTGVIQVFGVWFNLASISTDALPTDFENATFAGEGLIGFVAGSSAAITFIDTAEVTKVPLPPALLLFGSGLVALFRFSRQ